MPTSDKLIVICWKKWNTKGTSYQDGYSLHTDIETAAEFVRNYPKNADTATEEYRSQPHGPLEQGGFYYLEVPADKNALIPTLRSLVTDNGDQTGIRLPHSPSALQNQLQAILKSYPQYAWKTAGGRTPKRPTALRL